MSVSDHAVVRLDGVEIPLIGVDRQVSLETCDLCGSMALLQDTRYEDGLFICRGCHAIKARYQRHWKRMEPR